MQLPSRMKIGSRRAESPVEVAIPLRAPLVERVATPQHFVPPTPRELRAQAVKRLQVGLFGLASMLLLVGLANIIMQHARLNDPGPVLAASRASSSGGAADPLADIGVAPAPDASTPPHRQHR